MLPSSAVRSRSNFILLLLFSPPQHGRGSCLALSLVGRIPCMGKQSSRHGHQSRLSPGGTSNLATARMDEVTTRNENEQEHVLVTLSRASHFRRNRRCRNPTIDEGRRPSLFATPTAQER